MTSPYGSTSLKFQSIYEITSASVWAIKCFTSKASGGQGSFMIRRLAKDIESVFGSGAVKFLSPTGVAVENLLPGSSTIHTGFCINPKTSNVTAVSGEAATRFLDNHRNMRLLGIDEITVFLSPKKSRWLSSRG